MEDHIIRPALVPNDPRYGWVVAAAAAAMAAAAVAAAAVAVAAASLDMRART